MLNLTRPMVLVLALVGAASVGCTVKSDSSSTSAATHDYDPLFDAPQGAGLHTDDIVGLWETTQTAAAGSVQVRILFRNGQIQLANRCTADGYEAVTVGVTVQATFGSGKITVSDKGGVVEASSKGPSGKPDLICNAKLTGPGEAPYALGAGKLQALGFTMAKITD
jgi:hypothetical protein